MELVKTMHEVSSLYAGGLIEAEDGLPQCPVCKKVYKRLPAAQAHVEKMSCYRLQDVFDGTEYENYAHTMWTSVMAIEAPRRRTHLKAFRNDKRYGPFLRFILFTSLNQVDDKGLYYSWLSEVKAMAFINQVLSEGIKEERLREYRIWLQRHPEYIDSETFIERHGQHLIDDPQFFIRSIEKSHVAIAALDHSPSFPLEKVVSDLPIDYYHRLEVILNYL